IENDNVKYPSRKNIEPLSISVDGVDEWYVNEIIDERKRGRGQQYYVCFTGCGPEGNRWLPRCLLANNEALDQWLA
ncbi:hypothetical protein DFH07DRAFT_727561, partial [Mycena maculata]